MSDEPQDAACRPCQGVQTRNWYAWNNRMPPPPDELNVVGQVYVGNPGVDPLLTVRSGSAPGSPALELDLWLCQKPGIWPMVMTWKEVRYSEVLTAGAYARVRVVCEQEPIADLEVVDVH